MQNIFALYLKTRLNKMKKITTFFALALVIVACSSDDDNNTASNTITKRQEIDNYATIVNQSYLDSYNETVEMKTAIDAFVANPTATSFSAAKQAWFRCT